MKNIEKDTKKLNSIKETSVMCLPQFKESLEWLTTFEFVNSDSIVITDEIVSKLKSALNTIDNFISLLARMKNDINDEKIIMMMKGNK